MAWKQDLAKVKQQFKPEAAGPKAKPKPAPKPKVPSSLDDEDAVFLSAMGLKPSAKRNAPPAEPADSSALFAESTSPEIAPPPASRPAAPETFQEALKDLKGLKPMGKRMAAQPPPAPPEHPGKTVQALPSPVDQPPLPCPPAAPPEEPAAPAPHPFPAPTTPPVRFQLAAGMALEVDGCLDLRNHSRSDAMDRLKDRLGDGKALGWRSLQVILGADPILHEGLLELLASGQVPMVARYAQAPVPMGGAQAWLLYFGPVPTPS